MTIDQIRAAQRIGLAVLESIQAAGELGAPSGVLYAALQQTGCSLSQFQSLMAPLEGRGFVTQENHCFTITKAGEAFINQLRSVLAQAAPAMS